jgi:hypothetical protein
MNNSIERKPSQGENLPEEFHGIEIPDNLLDLRSALRHLVVNFDVIENQSGRMAETKTREGLQIQQIRDQIVQMQKMAADSASLADLQQTLPTWEDDFLALKSSIAALDRKFPPLNKAS